MTDLMPVSEVHPADLPNCDIIATPPGHDDLAQLMTPDQQAARAAQEAKDQAFATRPVMADNETIINALLDWAKGDSTAVTQVLNTRDQVRAWWAKNGGG